MLFSNYITNFLRSLGNSFAPFLLSFLSLVVNIIFAYLLTGPIKLDTRGPAIATLIANFSIVLAASFYIFHKYPYLRKVSIKSILNRKMLKDLLVLGLPLGFQWSILFIGSFVQSLKVNEFGNGLATKAVACYSNYETYLTMPLSVISQALLNYVGQNYGAKNKTRIKQGIKATFIIDLIAYAFILIIGLSTSKYIPYLFMPANELVGSNGEKIIFYTSTYLNILTPFLIFQGCIQISRSVVQGIKKPLIPFISGIGELIARILVCLYLPSLINPANPLSDSSYIGISFSNPIAWVSAVLIMGGSMIYIVFIKNIKELPDK